VIATAAANDAAAVSSAYNTIIDKHRIMFLQRAFDINPDGTAVDQALLPDHLKKYKSVKTVDQYNDMVWCLTHWGEDEYLAAALEDNMEASRIYSSVGSTCRVTTMQSTSPLRRANLWMDPPGRF
jgi:hypothetical protein